MIYLQRIADAIQSEVEPRLIPDGDTRLLFLFYAVLAEAKGAEVQLRDVHDAWVAWMLASGERHESLREFDQLPAEVRAEDEPYVRAIRMVADANARAREGR